MESKIEKIEGAYDIPILKDKLNRVIDYLNSQDQEETCTHGFDLNNRCTKCGVRGVKDMIAELQDTPEEKEELTKEEWFMLKLAVNEIHNKGNGAYDEISRKIDRLSKLKDNK